ncbi:MAG: hypothetical protein AAGL96_18790, partial [Pseudomonadota bacterium]
VQVNAGGEPVENSSNDPVIVGFSGWEFDGWAYNGRDDFERQLQIDVASGDIALTPTAHSPTQPDEMFRHPFIGGPFQQEIAGSEKPGDPSPFLAEMFKRATSEWVL